MNHTIPQDPLQGEKCHPQDAQKENRRPQDRDQEWKIVFIMDFDGVINYTGTADYYRERVNFGYLYKESLCVGGHCYDIAFSGEMMRKLKAFRRVANARWFWLTTWQKHTDVLDRAFCLHSDGPLAFDGSDRGKLECVLAFARTHPDTAFIWIDDTATPLFRKERFTLGNPHLIITPDSRVGLDRKNLKAIKRFLETLIGRDIPVEL
jgi:hypothetical protein